MRLLSACDTADDDDNNKDRYSRNPLTYHLTSPRLTPKNCQTSEKKRKKEPPILNHPDRKLCTHTFQVIE